jgi:hypothetical protein
MVAVQRLAHDGVADAACRTQCLLERAHRLGARHGQPGGSQQPGGEHLVARDVDR